MAYNKSKEEAYSPSDFEIYTKETVKNLLWLYGQFDWPQSPELVEAYNKDKFSKREGERWVDLLSHRLDKLGKSNRDEIMEVDSKKALRLKAWWEAHHANDKI